MFDTTIPAVRIPKKSRLELRKISKNSGTTESDSIRIAIYEFITKRKKEVK